MRSVAASKMRKTQDARDHAKPYAEQIQALVSRLVKNTGLKGQPLAETRELTRRLAVIFASDRGLCGAFNSSICRYGDKRLREMADVPTDVFAIGRRSAAYFRKNGFNVVAAETEFRGNVDVPRILEINRRVAEMFTGGEYDEVVLMHNYPVSAMAYRPQRERLLPLNADDLVEEAGDGEDAVQREYIFEPDPQTVLSVLLPKYVETKMLFTFLNSFTAEHQARMMAMSAANDNCEELIGTLTLQMNKARQTQITKEILEIVSGADALSG